MATILFVEDSKSCRDPVAISLRNHGHTVLTADNSEEALDRLPEVQPDLILLDIVMPRMHGLMFLKLLRRDERRCRLPVIIFSAAVNPKWRQEAQNLGVSAYLIKASVSLGELRSLIDKFTGGGDVPQAEVARRAQLTPMP